MQPTKKNKFKILILQIFFLSIKNIFEKKIFKWVLATIVSTAISLLVILSILSILLLNIITPYLSNIPLIGNYMADYFFYGILLSGFFISNILFAPLATTVFSLFQEKVIKAIEVKYYHLEEDLESKNFTMLYAGFKILVWSLLINIILFPISLIWGGSILWLPSYILIIGFLISKEYSDAINIRRYNFSECKMLRNLYFWEYWIAGIIGAILFIIPIINLLAAPYISIFMVHLVNKKESSGPKADN